MPDAVEAVRQDMDQETADELVSGQPHDLLPFAGLDPIMVDSGAKRNVCIEPYCERFSKFV